MNVLYRPITKDDFDALFSLSKQAGVGVTSLQFDKKKMEAWIELSIRSLAEPVVKPGAEKYLFVLEDLNTNEVVGTSGLIACIGEDLPFYNYRISTYTRFCKELNITHFYDSLALVNDYHGATEIGSLVLSKTHRGLKLGEFLSRARFLFMANHPERFSNLVIAEMRGISDEQGRSPFWDSLGRHFFKMDFDEADRLSELTNKQFIADLMPRGAIYTELLSSEAQAAIGQPHPHTQPAYRILQKEGFTYRGYIDIFDGGPVIEAQQPNIHTIRLSQVLPIVKIAEIQGGQRCMVSSTTTDFRAMMSETSVNEGGCIISPYIAEHCRLKEGDSIRVCPL